MDPDAERLFHEGNAHLQAHDHGRAEACFRQAVTIEPLLAEAHANLGWVVARGGEADLAGSHYQRALALSSGDVQLRLNYGAFLARMKRYEAAERVYFGAVDLDPVRPQVWSNLAALYAQMERFEEAEDCCRKSLSLDPGYVKAHINLAFLCLRRGLFGEGLAHYEWRPWQADLSKHVAGPRWAGESLIGKSIVVGHEAGHGDAIQFSRYAGLLKQRGASRVALVCPQALRDLFASLDGVDAVVGFDDALAGDWDVWTSLMSLPFHLQTRLDTIPATLPYLRSRPDQIARWGARLPSAGARVGLAWRGNATFENDADRSIPSLDDLRPLGRAGDVRFISLQLARRAADKGAALDLFDITADIESFADTAAIISNLDLVISVDTAVAHLAAALGKPCWVMLPRHMTDWRWLSGRTDSPWYPGSMRLFRQPRDGDWATVVAAIGAELTTFLLERSADAGN